MAHINGSGVQQHSAGANFPYITFRRDLHASNGAYSHSVYVVTIAGDELGYADSWRKAEDMAADFKEHGVKDRFDVQWLAALKLEVEADAEKYAVSRSEGLKRQRNDYAEMYGDPDYVPMGGREVLASLSAEAAGFRGAEAERVAAREALERAAENEPLFWRHDAMEQQRMQDDMTDVGALQLARRALGIIA